MEYKKQIKMHTDEDSKEAMFYALNKDGEYVPIGELEDVTTFVEEASKAIQQLVEAVEPIILQISYKSYKRLSAEVRFKKKHRRRARIDRKNRRSKKKT